MPYSYCRLSFVKIGQEMVSVECSQGCYGRTYTRTHIHTHGHTYIHTDGPITISPLGNFVNRGDINRSSTLTYPTPAI